MPLIRVRIEAFRCLGQVELELDRRETYVFGPNGAGKTSLLEALFLLGRGRSFRTRHTGRLIQWGSSGFTVYGEVELAGRLRRMGAGWQAGEMVFRLDGAAVRGAAQLAETLPVHVLEPGMHQLVEGGPRARRQFLDWGVFHVEPGYLEAWRRYRRLLGQRNAALKAGGSAMTLAPWTESLADAGEVVHRARARYMAGLAPVVAAAGERLLGQPMELRYRAGWAAEQSLRAALEAGLVRDRAVGATQAGPHRADLTVQLGAHGVREEASRGQQKLVAAAMVLGQAQAFAEHRGDGGLLLVDDPAAELDGAALERLMGLIRETEAQRVITGLSPTMIAPGETARVFHVERGQVTKML